jgi:hypothetical protein
MKRDAPATTYSSRYGPNVLLDRDVDRQDRNPRSAHLDGGYTGYRIRRHSNLT